MEPQTDEQCDDGVNDEHSCDPSCRFPISGTVSAPGGTVSERVSNERPIYFVELTLDADGQSIAVSANDLGGTCDRVDTAIVLIREDPLKTLSEVVGGGPIGNAGECAALTATQGGLNTSLPAGTYYVAFLAESGEGVAEGTITIVEPSCGNGILEVLNNEFCDDGDLNSGDGCSEACEFEAATFESEPNNSLPSANGLTTASATIAGRIAPTNDVDIFSFRINAGETRNLVVQTYSESEAPSTCNNVFSDTLLVVEDENGTVLSESDDIDPFENFCSRITLDELSEGTFFIRVLKSPLISRDQELVYLLSFALREP